MTSTFEANVAFLGSLYQSIQYRDPKPARSGKLNSDGSVNVNPAVGLPAGYIWVRINGARAETRALSKINSAVADVPCKVGYNEGGELVAFDVDIRTETVIQHGNNLAPLGSPQPTPQTNNTPVNIDLLRGGRVLPTDPPSLSVFIEAYIPGGLDNGVTVSQSANIPGSTNEHRWALHYLDSDGAPQEEVFSAHTFTSNAGLLVSEARDFVLPDGSVRLYAVSLSNGQATIDASSSRFIDLRRHHAPEGTTGVGSDPATTTVEGTVFADVAPISGSPIALTAPRVDAPHGIAMLGGDVRVPSFELPTNPAVSASETDRWMRAAGNPVVAGTETWEEDTTIEPSILHEDGIFKMWYRGGGWSGDSALGYATSTDGVTWTKYGTDPIFGEGFGGYAGDVLCPKVIHHGDYYYCYFTDTLLGSGDLYVSRSANGVTSWTTPVQVLDHADYAWVNQFANSTVWCEDGNQWKMLVEGRLGGGAWLISLGTSTDPLTGWALDAGGALTDLQVVAGGMYGGPFIPSPPKFEGQYVLWYHASPVSGVLPTNIYRASSPDLLNWTQYADNPVLTYNGGAFEFDQVADPCVVEVDGKSYLYYDGDDNVSELGGVGLLTFDGSLAQLVGERGRTAWLGEDDLIPFDLLPLASASVFGVVKVDGTTITATGGVISSSESAVYAPTSTGDASDPLILDSDGRVIVGRVA